MVGGAALVVVIAAGLLQGYAAPGTGEGLRRQAAADAAQKLTCLPRGADTYCVYPGFDVRIPLWRDVIARIRTNVPPTAAAAPLTVAQVYRPAHGNGFGSVDGGPADDTDDGTVPVAVDWPVGASAGFTRLRLGIQVGTRLLTGAAPTPAYSGPRCHRSIASVIALWLATVSDPGARAAFRSDLADLVRAGHASLYITDSYSSNNDFVWSAVEGRQTQSLLDRPADDVRRLVSAHWAQLTDPATTLEQASAALGIPVPTPC